LRPNPCEFVNIISSLAACMAKDKTEEEISLLAVIFTQLGDTLATLAILNVKDNEKKKAKEIDDRIKLD
jgi:hypothetical protein